MDQNWTQNHRYKINKNIVVIEESKQIIDNDRIITIL